MHNFNAVERVGYIIGKSLTLLVMQIMRDKLPMDKFYLDPAYEERLHQAGLDTLDKALAFESGEFVSVHPRRGRTSRARLSDGTVVYVKTDNFTYFKQICKDLFACRKPVPNSVREREIYAVLQEEGFNVPTAVAWWRRSCLGWPGAAAMINLAVPGTPLDKFMMKHYGNPELCLSRIANAVDEFAGILKAGHDWQDHKPEHFFVSEQNDAVYVIDVERMALHPGKLTEEMKMARMHKMGRQIGQSLAEAGTAYLKDHPDNAQKWQEAFAAFAGNGKLAAAQIEWPLFLHLPLQ